jgi:hypothetical protein
MNSKTNDLKLYSSVTSDGKYWALPLMIKVYENGDSIEMIYKEVLSVQYYTYSYGPTSLEERVFKIVYSCIDGKWNKSERIYGQIIPPSGEQYKF